MDLDLTRWRLAVCRLEATDPVPGWVALDDGGVVSVTRTDAELSLVVDEASVPEGVTAERGWRALAVRGPLDFGLTGVLASLAAPLADAGVPVFVLSTYDTDWILVQEARLAAAVASLRDVGHAVHDDTV